MKVTCTSLSTFLQNKCLIKQPCLFVGTFHLIYMLGSTFSKKKRWGLPYKTFLIWSLPALKKPLHTNSKAGYTQNSHIFCLTEQLDCNRHRSVWTVTPCTCQSGYHISRLPNQYHIQDQKWLVIKPIRDKTQKPDDQCQ